MPYSKIINFLEYPNWIVSSKKTLSKTIMHRDIISYQMKSLEGLPTRFDRVVLFFLLQKFLQDNKTIDYCVTTTRYEIAKNIYPHSKSFSKQKYDRIMLALKRWETISIQLEDSSAYNKNIITYCPLIDSAILDKNSHKLIVRFNEQYVTQIQNCYIYKEIKEEGYRQLFLEYKKLARPLSARLYEILIQHLFYQYIWCIDIHDLKTFLTLEQQTPPSRVFQLLKPAVEEINKRTKMNINFDYDKSRLLCIFKRNK